MNALWSYSESRPTVGFQEMKEQIAWLRLGANNCNPRPPPHTRKPKPCSETDKNVNGQEPLETTTPQLTQSTVWQDMSKPLYSGCEQDTVACERTWSELATWILHSAIAKKQNRRSTTSSSTVPSGGNRDTSYGRRLNQPPTSCGERWKTCTAPPSSWQHVDWGSKHGWSTVEEEEGYHPLSFAEGVPEKFTELLCGSLPDVFAWYMCIISKNSGLFNYAYL